MGMVLQRKFPFVLMVIQLIKNLEPLYWRFFPHAETLFSIMVMHGRSEKSELLEDFTDYRYFSVFSSI